MEKLKIFLAEARTLGPSAKKLLTDGGGEFDCKHEKEIIKETGIYYRLSMSHSGAK